MSTRQDTRHAQVLTGYIGLFLQLWVTVSCWKVRTGIANCNVVEYYKLSTASEHRAMDVRLCA